MAENTTKKEFVKSVKKLSTFFDNLKDYKNGDEQYAES